MEDDYDEYRRWDGDVDVEVSFVTLYKLSPTLGIFILNNFLINVKLYLFKMCNYLYCFVVLLPTLVKADDNDDILENPEETLTQCLEKFSSADYIMEPGIFSQLKRYF